MFSTFALLLSLNAHAGTLAGVTLPDTTQVGGQTLVLNGMGLREKYFIDVYVGGLYIAAKSKDAAAIISADTPKRVVMHFIYKEVTKEQMKETLLEGIVKYPEFNDVKDDLVKVADMMDVVHAGDEIVYEYVPGKGVTVYVRGQSKGTVGGKRLSDLIMNIYVGPNPANANLKKGMLGG